MVRGVGTDIVVIEDLRRRMERSPGLEEKVFAPSESAYCRSMAHPFQHFAARFAAKEAVMKALGTGWGSGVDFRDIVVERSPDAAPTVALNGEAARLVAASRGRVHLSLSHAGDHAIAFVIVETMPRNGDSGGVAGEHSED
jgi:holo-[acyl-carrier protein] synthase